MRLLLPIDCGCNSFGLDELNRGDKRCLANSSLFMDELDGDEDNTVEGVENCDLDRLSKAVAAAIWGELIKLASPPPKQVFLCLFSAIWLWNTVAHWLHFSWTCWPVLPDCWLWLFPFDADKPDFDLLELLWLLFWVMWERLCRHRFENWV